MKYKIRSTPKANQEKVRAIKCLRTFTGLGLLEAKQFVERTFDKWESEWVQVVNEIPSDFSTYFELFERIEDTAPAFCMKTEIKKLIILAANAEDFEAVYQLVKVVR